MTEYKDYYVAFFDILGFKNLISKSSCDDILKIFDKAQSVYYWSEHSLNVGESSNEDNKSNPIIDPSQINIKIMSDSICIFVDSQIKNALPGLILTCTAYQSNMLDLPTPVLLRGGIARGNLYCNGDIIFGSGLTDAYLLESKNAKYPRVILTKNLFDKSSYNDENVKEMAEKMLMKDFDAFYSLNYIMMFCYLGANQRKKEIERTYTHIQDVLATTTDESIREKYLYLDRNFQFHYNNFNKIEGTVE